MKFLFFTDTHIRGTNPRNRKDNFLEALKIKFKEIKELVDNLNIDYILHGGDWFDRPDISPAIVREFAILVKEFQKPVYTITGNHDVYGHNPNTIERTMLGLIEGIGIINFLNYNDRVIFKNDNITVQLTGQHYNFDIDGENYKKYYIIEKPQGVDYAINLVHGMLLEKPFFQGVKCTLLDDIKSTQADITLAGHYHTGFGIKKIDSKYFVNPGSLVRITNSLTEIKRIPQVVYIDIDKDINIEIIPLKNISPGDEVIDRQVLEDSIAKNEKLEYFYKNIASSGDYKKINLNTIIEEIAINEKLNNDVKNEAVRRIGVATEEFKKII